MLCSPKCNELLCDGDGVVDFTSGPGKTAPTIKGLSPALHSDGRVIMVSQGGGKYPSGFRHPQCSECSKKNKEVVKNPKELQDQLNIADQLIANKNREVLCDLGELGKHCFESSQAALNDANDFLDEVRRKK